MVAEKGEKDGRRCPEKGTGVAKRAQSSIRLGKSEYKSTAFERREFRSQLVHLLVASSGWRVGYIGPACLEG